jgi:hypothetical protein
MTSLMSPAIFLRACFALSEDVRVGGRSVSRAGT